jgi:hypothetical protein
MEHVRGTAASRPQRAQLAIDLGNDPGLSDPPVAEESAAGSYAAWSADEIVRLHFVLLDDLRRLSEPETPLEERFELLEWVFTERAREMEPFSFGTCVRVVFRTCDPDDVREELRRLTLAWLRDAVARLPGWLGEQILRDPQWAAAELHRNPQWINEELLRQMREPDLFGAPPRDASMR